MKKFIKVMILFTLITILVSCSAKQNKNNDKKNSESKNERITVGFSIDTLAIERWQRDLDVFINKLKELGADAIVQNAGNSVEEQNRQLLYLLERNIDVFVILPKDADSLSDSIAKIKSKGIPVISYDRLIFNADVDLYLTIDSQKVGEFMAGGLLSRSTGTRWFEILGSEDDYNMTLIENGIANTLKNTPITIAHKFYTSGWNYDLSYQEMARLISEKNIPDAVICGNDAIASSVIQAISRYYNDSHILVCGQDADIAACQAIVQDKQVFTIFKPINALAELTAEFAVYLARGEDISNKGYTIKPINNGAGNIPAIWLEPVLVDKSNIDEVIIGSGFHSYPSIYGFQQ